MNVPRLLGDCEINVPLNIQNNSTTGFVVKNSAGTEIFKVDTTNNFVSATTLLATTLQTTTNLTTDDTLIRIGASNTVSDLVDSALYCVYNSSGVKTSGLLRKAGGGWSLFKDYSNSDNSPFTLAANQYDNLTLATLTGSTIQTSSGALSINPTTSTNFNSKPIYNISKVGVGSSNVPENSTNRVLMSLRGFQSSSSSPGIELSINTSTNPYLNMFVHSSTLSAVQFSSYWDGSNYKRTDATNIPVILRHLGTGLRISSAAASTADSNITWADNVIFDNNGGFKLGTDANQSYLTAYESGTFTAAFTGAWSATSSNIKYTRTNNMVCLTFLATINAAAANSTLSAAAQIPTRLRPGNTIYSIQCGIDNSGAVAITVLLDSSGNITIANSGVGNYIVPFTNSGTCGYNGFTICYTI